MPGEGTKSKYEIISVLDIVLKYVATKGYKKATIIWDGASGENRNKFMYLFIHRARRKYDFEYIRTCVGPPHHLHFFPDTGSSQSEVGQNNFTKNIYLVTCLILNAICFLWYSQLIFEQNWPVNNHDDLYDLAHRFITDKVKNNVEIKMDEITFINLPKHLYSDTEWFSTAKMQWREFSYSRFPNFAGKDVNKQHSTERLILFYMNPLIRNNQKTYFKRYYLLLSKQVLRNDSDEKGSEFHDFQYGKVEKTR